MRQECDTVCVAPEMLTRSLQTVKNYPQLLGQTRLIKSLFAFAPRRFEFRAREGETNDAFF